MSPVPLPCGPTPDPAPVAPHVHECACNRNWGGPCGPCVCEQPTFEGGEWGWQYGHVIDGEWRWEPRGERYASSRRPWWMGAPEPIAHTFGPTDEAHGDPARTALRPADAEAHSPEETR